MMSTNPKQFQLTNPYQAGGADAAEVAALACELWPEHSAEEMAEEYDSLLAREDAAVFLYREEGEAVGFAQCQLRRDYVEGTETSPVGYLEGIYVRENHRRQGIARGLLSACESWAGTRGCTEFASDCELDNLDSQRFHQAVGFDEANRIVAYVKKLESVTGQREGPRCPPEPGVKIMIETERLLLREYTPDDFDALYEIVSDPETMAHYPAPFDEARTRRWINWNLENYAQYGFGLWAVVLKETGEFIGDCGLTIQNIDGEMLPEIGYHIHKKYWRRGFAKEAARAARDWAFQNTAYNVLYSYMKYTNEGSWRTAMANGMKKVKEYPDPKNEISYAFAITRGEWEQLYQRNS